MKTKSNQLLACKKNKTAKRIKTLDESILNLGIYKIKEYEEIIKYF